MSETFKGWLLNRDGTGVTGGLTDLSVTDLPDGEVLVDVEYSTLNYKDGMVLDGRGGLVRDYPHVPGIDFAGTVADSTDDRYAPGDRVVLTGWRVGEVQWGGYAQKARVKADWLVPLPDGLSTRRAMAVGTAGFTAMLCIRALEAHGLTPETGGEVLVTGAAGGVGSIAVAILSNLGYRVAASTGRAETHDFLRDLGAHAIVDRSDLSAPPARPLLKARWTGAVDTVGSTTLAHLLAEMAYGGSVAACGLAGGNDLPTTVIPFLLRGVNLLGIDSVMCPHDKRLTVWRRIAADLPMDRLDALTRVAGLSDVGDWGQKILKGQVRGRLVIDVAG